MEDIRILVVDDEVAERVTLGELLRLEGYQVTLAGSGEEAVQLTQIATVPFDLVILDIRLPKMDGLHALEMIHRVSVSTMVILITGYGTLDTAIQALRKGAYDYLLKPCPVEDILATVRRALAQLRQDRQRRVLVGRLQETMEALLATDGVAQADPEPIIGERFLKVGEVMVDRAKHLVTLQERPVELTPTEFRLLEFLMERVDQVCTPQDLVRFAQGYEADAWGARSIVRVHIRRLRRKLEPDPERPRYIMNVRGVGYLFASSPDRFQNEPEEP